MLVTLEALVASVLKGEVVSFPTDTVPAVAAQPEYSAKIYDLKQRPSHKPLILMGDTMASLKPFVQGWHPHWQELADAAWPGPLTLVVPAGDRLPSLMLAGGNEVGIRIPNSEWAKAVFAQTGPLATTSANLSGKPAMVTAPEINQQFPHIAILDAPFQTATDPSTVIRWCQTEEKWELLRQGSYSVDPSLLIA